MNNGATAKEGECYAILYRLWENAYSGLRKSLKEEYASSRRVISLLGLSMELVLVFLYSHRCSFEDFVVWLSEQTGKDINSNYLEELLVLHEQKMNLPFQPVLSSEQMQFWEKNGFIKIPEAVSADECKQVEKAIWDFLGASLADSESWYKPHSGIKGLMLTLAHHPSLNALRQSDKIRNIFRQLYGTNRIFPLVDKCSFNPPETENYKFRGSALHWDTSIQCPIPYVLQGMMYVNDVEPNGGAFSCVPGFHLEIDYWISQFPSSTDIRAMAASKLKAEVIPGKAADFIIWQQALPHAATPNKGKHPRLAQYFTYLPEDFTDEREWE
ncbi:MAG: phytanoyl-CoA dioxygenase family protein [Bacteroidia bacterium]